MWPQTLDFWRKLTPLQLETRFLGTKLLAFSIGRGSGALKATTTNNNSHIRQRTTEKNTRYCRRVLNIARKMICTNRQECSFIFYNIAYTQPISSNKLSHETGVHCSAVTICQHANNMASTRSKVCVFFSCVQPPPTTGANGGYIYLFKNYRLYHTSIYLWIIDYSVYNRRICFFEGFRVSAHRLSFFPPDSSCSNAPPEINFCQE